MALAETSEDVKQADGRALGTDEYLNIQCQRAFSRAYDSNGTKSDYADGECTVALLQCDRCLCLSDRTLGRESAKRIGCASQYGRYFGML